MKNLLWIFVACSLSLPGADSRPNLSGQWRLDPAKCEGNHPQNMTVAIQQDDNSISVSAQEEGRQSAEFKCTTDGRNCKAKGDVEQVSVYYNGPMLVELDMSGHDNDRVIKKRLQLGQDGKTLEVEIIPVNPPGASEKLVFAKQ